MSNNIFFERGQMADKPNNYLWNGDCIELMKDIPDKSMDAIICDLPYGTTSIKWDSIIPFDLLWCEYNRIIKDNGAIVLFGAEPFSSALRMSNIKIYKYDWYWHKNLPSNFQNAKRQPMRGIETISVFYKKQPTYNPIMRETNVKDRKVIDGRKRSNGYNKESDHMLGVKKQEIKERKMVYPETRLYFKVVPRSKGYLHPTQKPLELLKYLVKTYTNENDWVLDNTCGSNTTGIACYDLNRNYIGIEKDIDIYNVAKKRVEKNILLRANKPKTLFDYKP
tara:strand:+ start:8209 stop:9045 length:837 start_codon:yes stop_codon:yes gene_type:complete